MQHNFPGNSGWMMGQGALSQMAQMGLSFGVGSYFLKNSRKAESEATCWEPTSCMTAVSTPVHVGFFCPSWKKEAVWREALSS